MLSPQEGDHAQVVVLTDGLEHPISTSIMKASKSTTDHILTKFLGKQISAVTIRISNNLQLPFILVKADFRWLRTRNTSFVIKYKMLNHAVLNVHVCCHS
jgi:hypothetical protein